MKTRGRTENKDRFVIIMAGGRGERFWPISREKTPKQLIRLLGDRSFLQQAVERVLPVVPRENVFVITNAVQADAVRKQLPNLPKANVVAEPVGRDTCAAVTLGAALVGARSTTGVMAVLPADHVIPTPAKFQQVLKDSFDVAGRGQVIVTIGIRPTEPATGYGYIQAGQELAPPAGVTRYKTTFLKAERFVEKPDLARAVEYRQQRALPLERGDVHLVLRHPHQQPGTASTGDVSGLPTLVQGGERPGQTRSHAQAGYPALQKISIDYAVMEQAQNVVVADGTFEWDDLGAWPALARHVKPDAEGNCVVADFVHVDGARNIIYDARTKGHRTPIACAGLRDAILVLTDDAVLLADKGQAEKIKQVVKKMGDDPRLRKLV